MTPLSPGDVGYIGIGSDVNSSHLRGAAEAPARVREVLHNGASGLTDESGEPVIDDPRFRDLGDHLIDDGPEAFLGIEQIVEPIVAAGARPLIVGGDHAITYPVLRAVAGRHGPLNVLHFDAHSDLYDEYDGNRLSHACPFARIMEEGLASRLVQVGIRSVNRHLLEQTSRFNVEVHSMNRFNADRVPLHFDGPTFVSFDIDALDPAFAPGVSHHEPGGLSVRQCLDIIQNLEAPLVGADIVEFNPRRDLNDITAMVTAKLVREIGARLLRAGDAPD